MQGARIFKGEQLEVFPKKINSINGSNSCRGCYSAIKAFKNVIFPSTTIATIDRQLFDPEKFVFRKYKENIHRKKIKDYQEKQLVKIAL